VNLHLEGGSDLELAGKDLRNTKIALIDTASRFFVPINSVTSNLIIEDWFKIYKEIYPYLSVVS